jgi:hypothetical protein
VNYSFIFGFKRETELGYRQVLLLGFGIAALALCSVHLNLHMEMDPKTKEYGEFTELLPLNVLIVRFLQILFFKEKVLSCFSLDLQFFMHNLIFCFPCSSSSSYCSGHSTCFIAHLASSSSRVSFTVLLLLSTRWKLVAENHEKWIWNLNFSLTNFLEFFFSLQVTLPDFFLADQLTSQVSYQPRLYFNSSETCISEVIKNNTVWM